MQTQVVTLDVLKPIGTTVDLSDSFNARVGDKMTPFQLFITEGGVAKDLKGMHPELEAEVGNGALRNGVAVMAAGAKGVHWVGSTNNVTGYNQLTLAFPPEVFPQSGFCYGHLILTNDAGVRETSVDIWFQVLDGTPLMGLVADHYDSELQLELAKAKNANDQFSQEMRDTYNQQVTDAQNALTRASSDLSHLAISVGQVQSQIDAGNVITRAEFKELDDRISAKLSTMRINPEAFENEAALRAKYPQGNDQLNVTIDNGHLWVWIDGYFKDCGPFQTAGIDQKLVDQIKEALAFANGDNFIANGSFTTGNVEPAMTTNDDTKLAITDYLGQKWLQITAVGNSSMRGAQWVIDRADKITAIQNYPLNINFDIQSSVAQTFNIDIHFFNNNGQDMNNAINIDQLSLNPWELLHYNKTIDLDISSLAGVAKIVIMVYSNNAGEYGTVLITKLKINVKYNTNALPGPNLLQGKPWTANNDSIISKTTYLGEEWYKLTSLVNSSGRGYQWIVDDADKVSLLMNYPLKLAFNLDALTVSQTFNLDVHFYDKNGNDLNNSYTIDRIQANAGQLIHYDC